MTQEQFENAASLNESLQHLGRLKQSLITCTAIVIESEKEAISITLADVEDDTFFKKVLKNKSLSFRDEILSLVELQIKEVQKKFEEI